ncbi:hypothetical protein DIPPA_15423 [Diplonema papillatum]|nr:hypothetical protein DIPPA_15423 [Diplonema papillatum]
MSFRVCVLCLVTVAAVQAQQSCEGVSVRKSSGSTPAVCPGGLRDAPDAVVTACAQVICSKLGPWEIARGATKQVGGPAYQCKVTSAAAGINDRICQVIPPAAPSPGSPSGGLTGGGVFLILFFVGFFVYFAAGSAYMYKVKGETGVNVIPNVELWKGLPGLMKDGAAFLKGKVTGGGSEGAYHNV